MSGHQVANALAVPVTEVLLVPAGVDLRVHTELIRDRGTRGHCALQTRGDHACRPVADERANSGGGGTGLAQALGIQRGVRSSSPVKLARGGEVGDTMTHQHDPVSYTHL